MIMLINSLRLTLWSYLLWKISNCLLCSSISCAWKCFKFDMCHFEGKPECFNSSLVVGNSLFKYNILFKKDEIIPSDIPNGVNPERSIVLNSFTWYSNQLCCDVFPPRDGNRFLDDEITLVGKECYKEEGAVCFSITCSSWCVQIAMVMTHEFELLVVIPIKTPYRFRI